MHPHQQKVSMAHLFNRENGTVTLPVQGGQQTFRCFVKEVTPGMPQVCLQQALEWTKRKITVRGAEPETAMPWDAEFPTTLYFVNVGKLLNNSMFLEEVPWVSPWTLCWFVKHNPMFFDERCPGVTLWKSRGRDKGKWMCLWISSTNGPPGLRMLTGSVAPLATPSRFDEFNCISSAFM